MGYPWTLRLGRSFGAPLLLCCLAMGGCQDDGGAQSAAAVDTADASFADGKADGLQIESGSPAARAILKLANTASLVALDAPARDGGVGLDRRAAEGIVAQRPFSRLSGLDAVPYVGPVALSKLNAFVVANDLIDTTPAPTGVERVACSYSPGWIFDDTSALRDAVISTVTMTPSSSLTELLRIQIWTALIQSDVLYEGDPFAAVWDYTDDGDFVFNEVVVEGAGRFTWIRFYAGDTQAGVVFNTGTAELVAEISDGDILGCVDVPAPTPEAPDEETPDEPLAPSSCDSKGQFPFADRSSSVLRRAATPTIELTPDSALSASHEALIRLATTFLEMTDADDELSAVWEASDDETFELFRVAQGEAQFDWIRFYAGDTEIGVVFDADSTRIVGRVDDGWVVGCD